MEIKDVQANQGNIDIVAEVVNKEEPRSFEKFGKQGRVCKASLKDGSGEIKLTLWNEDVDSVKVGDKIHLQNGWCSEYQGEKQLSSGKFGKIEVVEGSPEMLTNDAGILQGDVPDIMKEAQEEVKPEEDMPVDEEELVE